jgi:hypothetical protein
MVRLGRELPIAVMVMQQNRDLFFELLRNPESRKKSTAMANDLAQAASEKNFPKQQ